MIKDDNSHGEGRDLGMDELQFDDIDSMLASESSSEPNGLEGPSIDSDPLESLVASSGEEYPSSFENDFYFHPEETGSNPSLEDIELTDPVVDVEIEKLLDVDDFVDSSTSNISNLESDDSFFNPGDSAPDEGMDFSELDNYLTDESDAIDFGEESDDIEELDLSDQDKEKNISSHEDDFLNEEGPIALSESELEEIVSVDEPLPDFISPSPEEENITLSNLDGILGGEELSETDTILETTFDESEEDGSIAFSGSELDDILNTTTDESTAVTNAVADDDLPDFITHTDLDENEEGIDSSLDFEPETTSFESEPDEAIALSDEELGNLLASENEEGIDSSLDFEPETTSFESESEEAIALSDEELGNLLASENEEGIDSSLDFEPETTSFESESEEAIALSDEELGNLLASENEEGIDSSLDFEPETTSLQGDDSISLPAHELDGIGDIPSSQEDLENFELSTDDSKQTQTSEATFFETEDSEPIALSLDELDHILTDNDDSNISENTLDEFPASGADWDDSPVSEQTAAVPLSEEESLEDTPTTVKEEDLNEILGELPPTSDLDAFDSIDDNVSKEKAASQVVPTEDVVNEDEMVIVLDEYAEEEKSSPIEELRKTPDQSETPKEDASRETPSKEEMKRIMTYLDELLGNLPDDLIREFSRSDYFELYKKLMKQIGV
ncbi:hypothetical protein ISU82_08400 [Leptospira borgpetersenii serovar Balcanica]|uniref:hypothetical protein n=1 Tax=Leptospira borgpetersenii TaxID=174 RepID=UPI00187F9380|nr:hypothetical protein [Leptospira borgpetersenii]MBE8423115.1 hypothetical protein [Leptospira borgpetersenii serovar Balcanica]MBF3350196.1 hypothetical protein [Leptospira borgpetersenii serovar Balcanica]